MGFIDGEEISFEGFPRSRSLPSPDCECDSCYVSHNRMPYSMKREMREAAEEFQGRYD